MANQNRGRGFVLRLDSELLRVPLFLLWVVCGGAFIITVAVGVGSVCSCCSCWCWRCVISDVVIAVTVVLFMVWSLHLLPCVVGVDGLLFSFWFLVE